MAVIIIICNNYQRYIHGKCRFIHTCNQIINYTLYNYHTPIQTESAKRFQLKYTVYSLTKHKYDRVRDFNWPFFLVLQSNPETMSVMFYLYLPVIISYYFATKAIIDDWCRHVFSTEVR